MPCLSLPDLCPLAPHIQRHFASFIVWWIFNFWRITIKYWSITNWFRTFQCHTSYAHCWREQGSCSRYWTPMKVLQIPYFMLLHVRDSWRRDASSLEHSVQCYRAYHPVTLPSNLHSCHVRTSSRLSPYPQSSSKSSVKNHDLARLDSSEEIQKAFTTPVLQEAKVNTNVTSTAAPSLKAIKPFSLLFLDVEPKRENTYGLAPASWTLLQHSEAEVTLGLFTVAILGPFSGHFQTHFCYDFLSLFHFSHYCSITTFLFSLNFHLHSLTVHTQPHLQSHCLHIASCTASCTAIFLSI